MARNLEEIMRLVASLLAKAESTQFEEEAKSYRERAEVLMRKYRIEEEALIAQDPSSIKPTFGGIDITTTGSQYRMRHSALFNEIAYHCGIRYVLKYSSGAQGFVAHAVGYDSDIRYAQFLHNAARLAMIEKLEPDVKPKLSDMENVYRLRSAGIDRQRIAKMLWGAESHNNGLKVGRLYKQACEARGEDPVVSGRNINAKTYREVYAREFVRRFADRLRESRDGADTNLGSMQLHGRQERVDEAFYERFPEYRPSTEVATPEGPCERCAKTKHASGKCSDHRVRPLRQMDLARYERMYESPAARRAAEAGHNAANGVELVRTPRTGKLEEDPSSTITAGRELEG